MKVIMRFYGHDIEGDAATLARINNELTDRDAMLAALQKFLDARSDRHGHTTMPIAEAAARAAIARS